MKNLRWRLYVVAFLSGFSLMVFELAAARILAPSIGSSTYAWTSVIGVIIAALSLGYFIGGRAADRRKVAVDISYISLAAALLVVVMVAAYPGVLDWSVEAFDDARWQGLVVSLLLFAPVSTVLGMLQPYLVKQNVRSLEASGRSVANLSALEAIGGIAGTFMAGFILFGYLGSRETMLVVAGVLVAVSWLIAPRQHVGWRLLASVTVLLLGAASQPAAARALPIDTPSAHYEIIEGVYVPTGRTVRGLATGPNGIQSAIYLDKPSELVFWYNQQLARVVSAAPEKQRILVLGGGTFTLPQYLALQYRDSTIDVVEIDPALAGIAREHFNYKDPSNVHLVFEDARAFLNTASGTYDVILVDVYGDASVPFSLMTREYGDRIAELSHEKTVVAANMIAGEQGACGELLEYYAAPYSRHFENVAYWREDATELKSNLIAVFSRQALESLPSELSVQVVEPLSDNFAPAERLQQACQDYARSEN